MTIIQVLAGLTLMHLLLFVGYTRWHFKRWSWRTKWWMFWLHHFWVWALPPLTGVVLLFIPNMCILGILLVAARVLHWLFVRLLKSVQNQTAQEFDRVHLVVRHLEVAYEVFVLIIILTQGG